MNGTTPTRPEVRPPRPWTFPTAESLDLDNGVRMLLYRIPGQYVVSAGVLLDAPLNAEPSHLEGVSTLLASTMTEGSVAHPGTDFADAVESCGAIMEATAAYSHLHALVDVPGARLPEAVRLLVEAVATPALADEDVERHRTLLAAQVEQQLATSAGRANHAVRRALIDPAFRASRMKAGEPDTLADVRGDDVRAHHAATVGPRGALVVVAGDFDPAVVGQLSDAVAAWQNPHQQEIPHETPAPRPRGAWLIDRPGSVQADIRLGWYTIDRTDPRWPALQLATHALGGAYLSRLNRVLREERGFTYGAGLVNTPMRTDGLTHATGSFRNEVVGEALSLMPGLLDTEADPITAREVDRARDYLTGTSPLRYATASGVTGGVLSLAAAGLDSSHIDDLLRSYRSVTPEAASEAASALVDAHAGTLVVVGDAGALEGQIRAAGWEPQVIAAGDWL